VNIGKLFRDITKLPAAYVGTVTAVNSDGTVTATTAGGSTVRVRSGGLSPAVANDVLIQSGAVIQVIASLTNITAQNAPDSWP
jgi:hypothetical protein